MHHWCTIINLNMSSKLQSGQGIRLLGHSLYISPLPVHFWPTASSDIPYWITPGWHVMALELETFFASQYHGKRPMSMLRAPWRHSGYCNPTMLFSEQNSPKHYLTASPSPSWATSLSFTINRSQLHITLSIIRLKRVGKMIHPWVFTLGACK